ncbi:hypothetical protein COB55_05885, partial [Candidatus Wolfebacteria bacterium]
MQITEQYKGFGGVDYILEYHDADSFNELPYSQCRQVYGVCFHDDKLVIGYGGRKKNWGLIGGEIEKDESGEFVY